MATQPLSEIVAEPVAPPPSATAFAESHWIPLPPELAQSQAIPSEPRPFLRPEEHTSDPEPLPDPAAAAKPRQRPTLLQYLFFATGGALALVAVLILADNTHKQSGDSTGALITGTGHTYKPSAYGDPLQPQPAHHFRTVALPPADSEPNPADSAAAPESAASPDASAQSAPTGNDPTSPAEQPQTNAPASAASSPPADSLTL
jgi:hypothetical protein